jgi:CBS domain-containing membrane protein
MTVSVAQLMTTRVVAMNEGDPLEAAMRSLHEAGVRHLPVLDRSGRLAGVVSQQDLGRALDVMRTAEGMRQPLKLRDIMHTPVLRATPELPAHQAAAMMIEHKIGMLPVVDEREHVIGVVTDIDFLEVAREALLGVEPSQRARA